MDNLLNKNEILTKKKINYVFKNGNVIYGKFINLVYCDDEKLKICFAVSKNIKKCAVKNKLKRQLREIYRTNKFKFVKNKNVILIAKKEDIKFSDLKNEILTLINSIH